MDRHNEEAEENGDLLRRTVTTGRQPIDDPPIPARQPDSKLAAVHDHASEPPVDYDALEPLNLCFDALDPIPDLHFNLGSEPLHENPNPETSDKSSTVAEPPLPARQPDAEEPPIPTRQPERTSEFPALFYQLKHLNPNLEEELRRRNRRGKTSLRVLKSKPKKSSGLGVQKLSVKSLAVRRRRSNPKHGLRPDKCPTVNPPYPWATDKRASVHTMAELESRGITTVVGKVQCKKCETIFEVGYDLKSAGGKLIKYMAKNKDSLNDRSAPEWDTPAWLDCHHCGRKKCVKAVVTGKKRGINWLFLFLGGFLCCCNLEHLKYFCKHTGNHRTGAKNRLLYLTYLGLCKQLDPSGPFNPPSI